MNSWSKSCIAVFLGVVILLAGSSLTLAKMVCLKSGATLITLTIPEDCCGHDCEGAPVTIDEKCCDISSMHIETLQYLISSSQNIQKSTVCVEVPALTYYFDSYSEIVSAVVREYGDTELTSHPPIRILTGTFLI